MKFIIKHIAIPVLLALLVTTIAACNKEDLETEKGIHVLVNGYNGSGNALQIIIDTTKYGHNNYMIKPASSISFNAVYTYRSPKEKILTITDTVTKKVLLSKPLPAAGTKANFNFIYLDGRELEVNPPAADPATNKLGFYVYHMDNDEPFDIFLYRMDDATGREYRHYLAKNIKPKTWVYIDYQASPDFSTHNLLTTSSVCFTKAGTTDQWAFQENEAMSKLDASGFSFPKAGEKGLVQPYFLTPGTFRMDLSRLFFYPDRP